MDSKKRSHDQITPQSLNGHFNPSNIASSTEAPLSSTEPTAKRPKLQRRQEDLHREALRCALRSLAVEPSTIAHSKDHKTTFEPVPGRETECTELEAHFQGCFESKQPRPVFICGPPGCGKTASLSKILSCHANLEAKFDGRSVLAPYTVRLNCASDIASSSSSALYKLLCSRLSDSFNESVISKALNARVESDSSPTLTDVERLAQLLRTINEYHVLYSKQTENTKPFFVLVLVDEIDHLLLSKTSFSAEIHFLFTAWQEAWGIISIVAISNAHDLFDRNLPSLANLTPSSKSGGSKGVKNIPFKPYDVEQLERIFNSRVSAINVVIDSNDDSSSTLKPVIDAKALKFLCAKISKLPGDQAGDVRVLLDLTKLAIMEAEELGKYPVTIDIILKIWKLKMAPPTVDPISQLTLQQKCALVCLLGASRGTKPGEGVRPVALETQWKTKTKQFFPSAPPQLSELWAAISLLEGIGHVQIISEKGNRKTYKMQAREQVQSYLAKDPIFGAHIL